MTVTSLGKEIGHGGFGVVYEDLTDPGTCIKVSSKNSNCRKWSNEYKKIVDMISQINKTTGFGSPALSGLKHARIVRPSKFVDSSSNARDGKCYMYMPRIYRPDGAEGPTIQAQLGVKTANLTHKGRGHFVGLKEIADFAGGKERDKLRKWLKRVSYELGKLMALIHYVGRNDAVDIEVYMGKLHRGRTPKFFVADFDMSESIVEYSDEVVGRLVWSLEAVPYFPIADIDSELYDSFSEGYLRVASKAGRRDIAERVLEDYAP